MGIVEVRIEGITSTVSISPQGTEIYVRAVN